MTKIELFGGPTSYDSRDPETVARSLPGTATREADGSWWVQGAPVDRGASLSLAPGAAWRVSLDSAEPPAMQIIPGGTIVGSRS